MSLLRYTLHNGVEIPAIGLGTWNLNGEEKVGQVIRHAIAHGYRLIDDAEDYGNEKEVGKAIRSCGIPREELFITSKAGPRFLGYERTHAAFEQTMKDLGLTYLDLYLVHWPGVPGQEKVQAGTWKAFEELYEAGRVRAIGVSNFWVRNLKELMAHAKIMPMVNQIEMHPGFLQPELLKLCADHHIRVEAFSPLAHGTIFDNDELKELAEKYEKSVSQISLRWIVQHGAVPLPKASSEQRLAENIDVFGFAISDEDMEKIDRICLDNRVVEDPDERVWAVDLCRDEDEKWT